MPLFLPLLAAAAGIASPDPGRVALGQYAGWGAFRSGAAGARALHCWAVAEPAGRASAGARPFVAIASWPRRIAGQLHVRLRTGRPGQVVTLVIGDERFPLIAGQTDAWAQDARADARIVAAMRRHDRLDVQVRGPDGRHHADHYPLAGVASAIDAAAVGCLP